MLSIKYDEIDKQHLFKNLQYIDAMSFYQIYENHYDFKRSAFVSFGGALTNNQIDREINSFKNARFFSGFDNDSMAIYMILCLKNG